MKNERNFGVTVRRNRVASLSFGRSSRQKNSSTTIADGFDYFLCD